MKTQKYSKRELTSAILLDKIQNGGYEIGDQFASEKALMQELGICKGTIREAISTLLDDGLLERRRGIGTFVRSRTPANKIVTTQRKEHQICLVKKTPSKNLLEMAGLDALHTVFDPFDYLIRSFFPRKNETMEELIGCLISKIKPEAFMLAGFPFTRSITDMIRNAGCRLVTIGQPEDGENVPFVDTDHYQGMYQVIDFLIANNHQRIALFDNSCSHDKSFNQRRNGYLDAYTAHNLIPDARLLVDVMLPEYELATRVTEMAEIFSSFWSHKYEFTAAVGYGESFLALWRELRERQIAIPDDLSVVMYGGGNGNSLPLPTLDCAHCSWDVYPMARQAAEMLLRSDCQPTMLYPTEFHTGLTIKSLI